MAHTLADVVMRRTSLGSTGLPNEAALQQCANILANELGWDKNRSQQEITKMVNQSPINM
jgi:glycerol-3-phosphate dehydrogenase